MYPVQKCPPQRCSGQKCPQKHPSQNRPPQNRPPQKCPPQKYLPQNILLRNILLRKSSSEISSSDMPIKTFQFLEEDFQLLEIMLYIFVMAIAKSCQIYPKYWIFIAKISLLSYKNWQQFHIIQNWLPNIGIYASIASLNSHPKVVNYVPKVGTYIPVSGNYPNISHQFPTTEN